MKLLDVVREVRRHLEENGRVSLRMLRGQYDLDDEALDELIEELVDVQRVARREENILVWSGTNSTGLGVGGYGVGGQNPPPPPAPRPPTPVSETRKVISIIFADLMGSTALQEGLDPESVNRVMDAYYQAVRGPVEAAGGTVVQLLGDGVLCAFGIPQIAQDDALRAVRAAVGIQQAFRDFLQGQQWLKVPIGLRVAVNTGEVVVSEEHPAGIGDPLNVAARLQQEARDGEVLIGQATRRLVANAVTLERAGAFALKGRAETVTAYRVVSLDRPTGATTAAFVGRDDELARIATVYEAARATPAARLVVVLGSPGLGKSRLIEEVVRRLDDATFAPVAAALRTWLGAGRADQTDRSDPSDPTDPSAALGAVLSDSPERTRIIAGIGALLAGSPASPEETFFVIRRFLTALTTPASLQAAQGLRPVVLVVDDLHWAEPLLLDLVEHLVQWGSGTPLLVLVGARPELRDLRSSLATPGGFVADVITLGGLDAGAAMRLAANVIGAADLPAAVAAKVLATSEGNPLFVGELVRMLVDEGAIERQGERWVVGANLASLEMPPTIHALLAARIERLRPEERTVLERAAVVGRHFSRSAVAALLGRNGSELDARLEALRRTELIERDTGWFLGEPVLRFHHVLIRDAAYRRLLKGTRAELHEHLADWIEAQVKDAPEHDETIGWHLEQAHQHRRELGPLDAKGKTLGERAAARLAAAGRRALARDDLPVAADLLGRAIDRLDRDDPARAELALDWCEALLAAGDVATGAKAIEELGRFVSATPLDTPPNEGGYSGRTVVGSDAESLRSSRVGPIFSGAVSRDRLRAWHTCFTGHLTVLTAPQALHTTAGGVAAAAEELAKLGDAAGEATGHFVHALALSRLGKVGACEAALDRALAAARRADDRRRANTVLAVAPLAALWGPSPVTRASGRCLDVVRVLRITQGAPAVEAVALSCQAVLEALRGRTDAARRMIASARKLVEDLGITQRLLEVDVFGGLIDLLEGDAAAAERNLRRAYDGLRDLGLGIDAARAAALLARALLAQDRGAEAEALSHESEALAGDDLKAAIAWRGVRAEALARRGEHTPAIGLANEAVEIAAATDALLDHADARLALAAALRAAGRGREADAEEQRAVALWEAKGATVLADGARRRGTSEPQNDPRPLPEGDHREVGPPPAPRLAKEGEPSRRVQPNAATAMLVRLHAHLAARDFDAVAKDSREDMESIDHPSGSSYGREAIVASLRRFFRSRDPHYEAEPLATLGDFLVLARRHTSASGGGGGRFDVGAYENDALELFEVDASGKTSRTEVFAADKLGAAVARLYERHAELLPEEHDRERAAATARSVAGWIGPIDPDRLATTMTPSMEMVDHRNLGTWSTRGAAEFLDHNRLQAELAMGFTGRTDGVLALAPDALLVRCTYFGIARDSGGAFENVLLQLFAFGADGLIARSELWEPDLDAEALARFDALTADAGDAGTLAAGIQEGGADSRPKIAEMAERPRLVSGRRVRPNAATAWRARFDAALAARDFDAVAAGIHEEYQEIDHPTGSDYGRDAAVASLQRLFRSRDAYYEVEPLATLGERLLLVRRRTDASGDTRGRYDVGPYENEAIEVTEVDAHGLCCRQEVFAADRLGAALVRLYERYAELLPEGQERTRAAGIARSLAAYDGRADLERFKAVFVPTHDGIDHRVFGPWAAGDAAEILRHFRLQLDLAPDFASRYDDVVAANERAVVVRMTFFGTGSDSGGPFENIVCGLFGFAADGRMVHYEVFEAEQVAEALVRFDEWIGRGTDAVAERPENTAARSMERFWAALDASDFDAARPLFAPGFVWDDRRPLFRLSGDVELMLASAKERLATGARHERRSIVGTAGDRVAVIRVLWAGGPPGGRFEVEFLAVHEVDEAGLCTALIFFDPDDARAAQREAWARWAAIDPVAAPWVELLTELVDAWNARDLSRLRHRAADGLVLEDHRHAGLGRIEGADAYGDSVVVLWELAPDQRLEIASWPAVDRHGFVVTARRVGTLTNGGAFESEYLWLSVGSAGRFTRSEFFEIEDLDAALARFEELRAAETT